MSNPNRHLRAQTAMELAVFGAILIFMVGVIVRQALSSSYLQNQSLRAMRQAMSTSYRYSFGRMGDDRMASHQTASILMLEDRLTAESSKYAAVDRTPYVMGASATYSKMLFYPVDYNENANLPIHDMFINGKQFPFTTAAFKRVELARSCRDASSCPAECNGNCCGPDTCPPYLPAPQTHSTYSVQMYPAPNIDPDDPLSPPPEWEPTCVETTINTPCRDECNTSLCTLVPVDPTDPASPLQCDPQSSETWSRTEIVGCAKLYGVVLNHPGFTDWCDGGPGGTSCDKRCADNCNPRFCDASAGDCAVGSTVVYVDNLTADERFDLDRNGVTDVPVAERADFSWEWFLVMGWDAGHKVRPQWMDLLGGYRSGFAFYAPSQNVLLRGEGIVQERSDCKKNCKEAQHTNVDVDSVNGVGDLKRESIMVDSKVVDETTGVIKSFVVMDRQEGDLDLTRGDADPGVAPGLQKETKMYSYQRDGTYLLLEEGRLYNPTDPSQFIRTTQKKDQLDIIERAILISKDTHRFCDSGGNVVTTYLNNDPTKSVVWPGLLPDGRTRLDNPVEACGNCMTTANMQRTCMDQGLKTILIRSRIQDKRGRKWITNTSGDDYVDFTVPSVP